jgi:hypothetical protein
MLFLSGIGSVLLLQGHVLTTTNEHSSGIFDHFNGGAA